MGDLTPVIEGAVKFREGKKVRDNNNNKNNNSMHSTTWRLRRRFQRKR